MAGDKSYKRVRLPKGLVRARIIPEKNLSQESYDKALESDFDANRAEYREVLMYGVPVKVKVEKDDGQEFHFYRPKK